MPEDGSGEQIDLEQLRSRILDFVAACGQPVLKEEGAEPLAIAADRFQLEVQSAANSLLLETWDDHRTVTRRIVAIKGSINRNLVLQVRKFGGRDAEIVIADTSRRGAHLDRSLRRKNFAERFRALLMRQFPGWTVERLSADRDLQHSFSEHYVRALVVRGQNAWAAIGVSEAEGDSVAAGILTDGLLWLDFMRTASANRVVAGLCLFVPKKSVESTAQRLPFLDSTVAKFQLFPLPAGDAAGTTADPVAMVDPSDYGNLRTDLRPPRLTAAIANNARERLREIALFPGVEEEISPGGELSLRYRGLEVAHATEIGVTTIDLPMDQVARLRSPESPDRRHPLYTRAAEHWMESILRADPSPLGLEFAGSPVYSQVLTGSGRTRGIIDLLTITSSGRLVVIELKADEDPRLPLQGLDYWMRIRWHLASGGFRDRGFFPGREISPEPPLLWLLCPAIRRHASNDVVLKYFSRQVPVSQIGVNEDWRRSIRVVHRA